MKSKTIKISLLFIGGSILFFAGCGPQDINDKEYVAQTAKEEGGCPTGGCSTGGCPTGDCEIKPDPDTDRTVQLPDQVTAEPTKVIPTGEKQIATDTVDYRTTRHVWQPSQRQHTVHKHRNLVRRHFTEVVYHPTFKRINSVVRTGSVEDQVMPTTEVVEPTVDYGCQGAAPAAQVVVSPVLMPYGHRYFPRFYR